MYIKNCHNGNYQHVMVDIYKNNYDESFKINDGLHPNLALCFEMGTHMNDSIINWSTFLVCHNLVQHYNCKNWLK